MKKIIRKDGTIEYEGTPQELAELESESDDDQKNEHIKKKKRILNEELILRELRKISKGQQKDRVATVRYRKWRKECAPWHQPYRRQPQQPWIQPWIQPWAQPYIAPWPYEPVVYTSDGTTPEYQTSITYKSNDVTSGDFKIFADSYNNNIFETKN